MPPTVSRGARWTSALLAVGAVVLAASGCAPSGSDAESITPETTSLYPEFSTYPNIPVIEDLQYGTADDAPLLLDVCLPDDAGADPEALKPRPAVISIHGGSWARGDKANLSWRSVCQWLASEGYVAVSVNYRLAPASVYPAQIEDVQRAVRWLRADDQVEEYSIDPTLIGVFGGSAGGNLAALLGTDGSGALDAGDRVAAVAELSGPTDLTQKAFAAGTVTDDFVPIELAYLGCGSLDSCDQARAASPLFKVDSTDPPFFVGHSTDERIPVAQSRQFVAQLRKAGVDTTFVEVEGAMHSIAMLDDDMRDRIAEFFAEKLTNEVPGVVPGVVGAVAP